jgi:hypothetical protein
MAAAFMAYPELRHPFEAKPIHAEGSTSVLYQGRQITLTETGSGTDSNQSLLINSEDLKRINGFELKPEGACYADMCIPLTSKLQVAQDGKQWFDLTAFADLLEQPYVFDAESNVWSFSEIPAKRDNMMVNGLAPDFEIPDRQGNVIRMTDLKGKKALIVTWSSW